MEQLVEDRIAYYEERIEKAKMSVFDRDTLDDFLIDLQPRR